MKTNNELIAEFLGVTPLYLGGSKEYEMYGVIDCIEDGEDKKHFFLEEEMLFDTDWNWLMPVVAKIEQLPDVYDIEEFLLIRDELATARIETTYDAVVEFIEWYNKL